MNRQPPAPLIALLGPSAVGKSSLLRLAQEEGFRHIIPVTTREPRPDDWDRECVSMSDFAERALRCELYNINQVYKDRYAYDAGRVARIYQSGFTPTVDVVLPGLPKLITEHGERFRNHPVVPVLLAPPSIEALRERAVRIGRFSEERWEKDMEWLSDAYTSPLVKHRIVNDTLSDSLGELITIADEYR